MVFVEDLEDLVVIRDAQHRSVEVLGGALPSLESFTGLSVMPREAVLSLVATHAAEAGNVYNFRDCMCPSVPYTYFLENLEKQLYCSPSDAQESRLTGNQTPRSWFSITLTLTVLMLKLYKSLVSAAQDVAETLGGDVKQTESELLQKLLSRSGNSESTGQEETTAKPAMNLSDLIAGMKVDHSPKETALPSEGRAQQVRRILSRHGAASQQRGARLQGEERELSDGRVNLFDSPPMGILKPINKSQPQNGEVPVLKTWQRLQERELKMAVTHPPSNIYEEMIQWTDQGKLWKFPINNEQGLEEEAKVFFAEHVFLERHLEGWCPPRGPVRHFMELVCVGLSKNPYITVKDKLEHIEWYRHYLEDKKVLLAEAGAITEDSSSLQSSAQ
ncbi:hypothetical protein PR048_018503 [Dryococelus australis]|uniref:Small ribosomal subunit protein mS31 n=1 Tax=Dryococelus australis TaxID=614101 RepID=A0ABQ9HCE7_9NEOP|nr:hypothetical protein PR048_018503 [Dryococelus australis]